MMDEAVSMASIFKQNGYKTYSFGKRHLRNAIDEGWDVKKGHGYQPDDEGVLRQALTALVRPQRFPELNHLVPSAVRPREVFGSASPTPTVGTSLPDGQEIRTKNLSDSAYPLTSCT